jgi:mannose-6-phosphate isomerase-like protein (cupin superfamily)
MEAVTTAVVAERLTVYRSQQVVEGTNGELATVATAIGSTTWHTHQDQDETSLRLRGQLRTQLRDRDVHLDPGDPLAIHRGMEHCPRAEEEVQVMLIGADLTPPATGGEPAWSHVQAIQAHPTRGSTSSRAHLTQPGT